MFSEPFVAIPATGCTVQLRLLAHTDCHGAIAVVAMPWTDLLAPATSVQIIRNCIDCVTSSQFVTFVLVVEVTIFVLPSLR